MRKQHDPIDQLKELLVREGVDEASLKEVDKSVKSIVTEATDFALTSPLPSEQELYTDILLKLPKGASSY